MNDGSGITSFYDLYHKSYNTQCHKVPALGIMRQHQTFNFSLRKGYL